jgi:NTE family protein
MAESSRAEGAQREASCESSFKPVRSGRVRRGVGLCLSGGGFRASIFHLGALRRLHELGVLQQLTTVSAVSGGSILAGFLAQRIVDLATEGLAFHDWEQDVACPFRRFVVRDLRTLPFALHLLWNWAFPCARVWHLTRQYRQRLASLKLAELPSRPEFVFGATDLVFGANFEFRRERIGDHWLGYAPPPADMDLAFAVAASSSFPPLFGPVRGPRLDYRHGRYAREWNDRKARGFPTGPSPEKLAANLCLSDGGLYDNLALEPVWKTHKTVLVCDGGAPMPFRFGSRFLACPLRCTSLILNNVGSLRRRWLMDLIDADYEKLAICKTDEFGTACHHAADPKCRLRGRRFVDALSGAYWSLSSDAEGYERLENGSKAIPLGYSRPLVKDVLANVRTDLDRFVEGEIAVLENHGYLLADAAVRKHLSGHLPAPIPPLAVPHPAWFDASAPDSTEGKARKALAAAHSDELLYFWKRWGMQSF